MFTDRRRISSDDETSTGTPFPPPPTPSSASNAAQNEGRRFAMVVFSLLGIGSLLPWNAFVNAEPYFRSRLCDSSSSSSSTADDHNHINAGVRSALTHMNSSVTYDTVSFVGVHEESEGGWADNFENWFAVIFNVCGVLSLSSIIALKRFREVRRRRNRQISLEDRESWMGGMSTTMAEPLLLDGDAYSSREPRRIGEERAASPDVDKSSVHQRRMVTVPLSLYFAVFSVTTALVLLPKMKSGTFLGLTLSSIAVCGVSNAVAQTGIVAVAGIFPPNIAISSFFSGQAAGGLAVSIANLATEIIGDPQKFLDETCKGDFAASPSESSECGPYQIDWGAFVYFALGSLVLGLCILGYLRLDRMPITAYFREKGSKTEAERLRRRYELFTGDTSSTASIAAEEEERWESEMMAELQSPALAPKRGSLQGALFGQTSAPTNTAYRMIKGSESSFSDDGATAAVWNAVRYPAVSLFLTLFVTLVAFPAWMVKIESVNICRSHNRLQNDLFVPLLFVVYNAADLLGRHIAVAIPIERIPNMSTKLLLASLSRIAFLPLFLLCNSPDSVSPIKIHSDVYPLTLLALFGVSNGVTIAAAFMHAPRLIPSTSDAQETSSTIMNLGLGFGLLFGSLCSFVYVFLGTGKWH